MLTATQIDGVLEVLGAIPEQHMAAGRPIDWGPPGNKDRALALAAMNGNSFEPSCTSCDFDLWVTLRHIARRA